MLSVKKEKKNILWIEPNELLHLLCFAHTKLNIFYYIIKLYFTC